jgi:hypothetical protein
MSYNPPPSGYDQTNVPSNRNWSLDKPPNFRDRSERPTGVTVLAILNIIGVLLAILLLLLIALQPAPPPPQKVTIGSGDQSFTVEIPSAESLIAETNGVTACISVVEIVIGLALAIGLWRLKLWARIVSLVVCIWWYLNFVSQSKSGVNLRKYDWSGYISGRSLLFDPA